MPDTCIRFDRFELWPAQRRLLRDGAPCALGARAFDVLCLLIERRAGVVSRKEVLGLVWAGLVIEEGNLSVQVSSLRKLLGERAITTVPNRGYQFTLPVTEMEAADPVLREPPVAKPVWDARFADPSVCLIVHCPTPSANGSRPWFTEAQQILVPSFGGRLNLQADGAFVASFASARAAMACARHLRSAHDTTPPGLTITLCGADELGSRKPGDLFGAGTSSDDVFVSTSIAGRLVASLDGDLIAAGDPLAGDAATDAAADPLRAFRTMPQPASDAMPLSTFSALPSVPTIAVLPFSGYDARGEGIGLGDVIADQLITLLSHNAGLHMISRLSTAAFRGRPCSMEEVAHHLRATYVVSGRYLDVDGRLTVDVEMADAARRHVAWKHAATDATSAIVRSDSLIALELAAGITHAVYANEIGRVPTLAMPDLPTHSLLLTAIGLLYRLAPSDFHKAKQALDALHERLPAHPQPLAWLSRWHLFRVVQGWTAQRDEDGRLAGEYARRALDAAPDSALALTMLGNVQTSFHRDPAGGEALYDQALAINPNESLAWLQKGNALSFRGEGQRAMEHIEKALSLSPLDPSRHFYQSLYASASLAAGEYARAVNAAQASLRLNREHVSTYRVLAIALSLLGRMDEARRAVAIVRRLEPELTVKAFVARSPGAKSGLAQRFGDALGAAGLPSGA